MEERNTSKDHKCETWTPAFVFFIRVKPRSTLKASVADPDPNPDPSDP
jgi:hypothetical protein